MKRRDFLVKSIWLGSSINFVTMITPLLQGCGKESTTTASANLVNVDGTFSVTSGVNARVISTAGDAMTDGSVVPILADGMACFETTQEYILVRNHEISQVNERVTGDTKHFDKACIGGTTTVVIRKSDLQIVRQFQSLIGTSNNCGGGVTPWNTWITCEEETYTPTERPLLEKKHGYAFEVDPLVNEIQTATPLTAMGRFNREGVAFDSDGVFYQTEDRQNACFYRFTPTTSNDLSAGTLEALAVVGSPRMLTTQLGASDIGTQYDVSWVTVDNPDPDTDTVRDEAQGKGAAIFKGTEGIIPSGDDFYFAASSGGPINRGQIFKYSKTTNKLELVFVATEENILKAPDNIAVNKFGDIIVCEDGPSPQRLLGVRPDGKIYIIAENEISEWAGACFSPDGNILFVNIQGPGKTLLLTADWANLRNNTV